MPKPKFKTTAITATDIALPPELIDVMLWQAEYYNVSIADIFGLLLPKGFDKKRRTRKSKEPVAKLKESKLNTKQQTAYRALKDAPMAILSGITGSGKSHIYIELIKAQLKVGKSVVVLAPEIALSEHLHAFLTEYLPNVKLLHSQLPEAERHLTWLDITEDQEPQVIVGPRSALMAPLFKLGAIIIDEFHDESYFSNTRPQHDAKLVATVLAKAHGANLLLGSATPDVTTYQQYRGRKLPIINLTTKAMDKADKPDFQVVDLNQRDVLFNKWLSYDLKNAITETLANNQQVILFHNRRGSATMAFCQDCGWSSTCSNCHLPNTLHADDFILKCHFCATSEPMKTSCPDCGGAEVITKGIGTKQIETNIKTIFPEHNVMRFDADNKADEQLRKHLKAARSGEVDIIIGTQLITKGLDLPKLGLVGVVNADSGMMIPDYRTTEKLFQNLVQLIGRVGRHTSGNKVFLQTYNPDSKLIKNIISEDWQQLYEDEISERKAIGLPPFGYILKVSVRAKSAAEAKSSLEALATKLSKLKLKVLGPSPAFREKTGQVYNWNMILLAKERSELIKAARNTPSDYILVFDPPSLL